MRKNKVYTKTGDNGYTSLISGKRVPKHDIRIKAYGSIDELISWSGLIRDCTNDVDIQKTLIKIQKQLMVVAAHLSIDSQINLPKNLKPLENKTVNFIEKEIDKLTSNLPSLKNFIIPGGHTLISYTHITRCICRKAERYITELDEKSTISATIIAYINRLSDYFFTLSRKFSVDLKIEEIKWRGN